MKTTLLISLLLLASGAPAASIADLTAGELKILGAAANPETPPETPVPEPDRSIPSS